MSDEKGVINRRGTKLGRISDHSSRIDTRFGRLSLHALLISLQYYWRCTYWQRFNGIYCEETVGVSAQVECTSEAFRLVSGSCSSSVSTWSSLPSLAHAREFRRVWRHIFSAKHCLLRGLSKWNAMPFQCYRGAVERGWHTVIVLARPCIWALLSWHLHSSLGSANDDSETIRACTIVALDIITGASSQLGDENAGAWRGSVESWNSESKEANFVHVLDVLVEELVYCYWCLTWKCSQDPPWRTSIWKSVS